MRNLVSLFAVTLLALSGVVGCDRFPEAPDSQKADALEVSARASSSSNAADRSDGMFIRPGWGNDHLWEFFSPKPFINPAGNLVFGSEADSRSARPFYVIGSDAGDDGAQSLAFFGAHDHVFPVPPKNKGTFNANWHVKVVIPGPEGTVGTNVLVNEDLTIRNAFIETHDMLGDPLPETADVVYAVKYDGDTSFTDLTSFAKVQKALDQGLVSLIRSPEIFVCPVRDIEG